MVAIYLSCGLIYYLLFCPTVTCFGAPYPVVGKVQLAGRIDPLPAAEKQHYTCNGCLFLQRRRALTRVLFFLFLFFLWPPFFVFGHVDAGDDLLHGVSHSARAGRDCTEVLINRRGGAADAQQRIWRTRLMPSAGEIICFRRIMESHLGPRSSDECSGTDLHPSPVRGWRQRWHVYALVAAGSGLSVPVSDGITVHSNALRDQTRASDWEHRMHNFGDAHTSPVRQWKQRVFGRDSLRKRDKGSERRRSGGGDKGGGCK